LASSYVILSDLPLPALFPVIYLLVKLTQTEGFLIPPLLGDVTFRSAKEYQLNGSTIAIKQVVFAILPVGLLIIHEDNRRVFLWRDSVNDKQYRDLVVMLKREY